jgi:phage pi2 protein 07
MNELKLGNVYEVKLLDTFHVYVCEVEESHFGLFDFISEKPVEIDILTKIRFKAFMGCARDGITEKVWKIIGTIDLEKNNLRIPDLAVLPLPDSELGYKNCKIERNGNIITVTPEEYKKVLNTGFIVWIYDDYKKYENYLTWNIDNLLNKTPLKSEWDIIQENGIRKYQKDFKLRKNNG